MERWQVSGLSIWTSPLQDEQPNASHAAPTISQTKFAAGLSLIGSLTKVHVPFASQERSGVVSEESDVEFTVTSRQLQYMYWAVEQVASCLLEQPQPVWRM